MNKVTSYLKNVGKSISYATVDVASSKLIPDIKEFTSTNEDIFKAIYSTVTHTKKSMQYGKKVATDSQIFKDVNNGIKNALNDIKTGNFYNKSREDEMNESTASSMFGDFDFDFNFDDNFDDGSLDDFQDSGTSETSISKGDLVIADSVSKSTNLSAQLISKTVANTNHAIIKAQLATTNMVMAQNVELMAGLRTSIAGMHESINGILKFAHENITTQINNESKYFETTTSIMQENNAILKEMLEMQRNLYKAQDSATKNESDLDKVFSGGSFDIKEYFKVIGKNIKGLDKTGMGSMLTADMGGGNSMLGSMMANPLGFVMTSIVERFIPLNVAKSISKFSKSIGNIFPAMIAKLSDMKKNNVGILGLLGDLLGIDTSVKKSIDTGNYKKGAVPFDGITRKAIVDVIPEHLSRIEAILSGGKPQRVYDYNKGKWISAKDIQKQKEEEYNYLLKDSLSDISAELREFIDTLKLDSKRKESVDADLVKMMKYTFENREGFFSPNEAKKNLKNYKFENDDIMEAMLDMMSKLPTYKVASISKNSIENKRRYSEFLKNAESQGDSIFRKLYDKSFDDYDMQNMINFFTGGNPKGNKSSSNKTYKSSKITTDVFKKATTNAREKAESEMEDDFSSFGKAYKNNKWQKTMDEIPGDSFIEKFKNANSMQARFALIMGSLNDIAKKPAAMLTGLISKADQAIYNLLFKAETNEVGSDGRRIKGLVDVMTKKMTEKWEELTNTLNDKILEPLAKKYGLEDKLEKFKTRAKEGLLGKVQKDENGRVIRNEYGFAKRSEGLLTPTLYALQKDYRSISGYTKDSIIDVLSPLINDPAVADFRSKIIDKRHSKIEEKDIQKLQKIIDSLTPAQKERLGKDKINLLKKLGIVGLAKGGKVTKAGLIAVSEGEEVTVKNKETNPNKIKQNEIGESNRTLAAIYDALLNPNPDMSEHEAQFGIPGFRKGGKAKGKKIPDDTLKEIDNLLKNIESSEKNSKSKSDNINKNKRNDGPISQIYNYIKDVLGLNEDPKKEQGKISSTIKNVLNQMEGKGPDLASKAIIGGGLGLLSGVAAGPILGASIGAAVSLTKNSKTVQKFLFGEVDEETGEIKEGLISKKTQDTFKKYLPDAGKYGVTGAVASLLLPFGPLTGAAIGAGIGLLKNSSTMNKMIFGEEIINEDGSTSRDNSGLLTPERIKKIKDYFPKAGAGAIAGLALGPFGLLGNAALGAGIGMLTGTEDFKDLIFGEKDSSGERFGGIKGALDEHFVQPLRDFGTNFKDDFFGFIKESMIDPLNRAITPIASEISYQTRRVVFGIPKMFAKLGKDYIGTPLMTLLGDRVVDPLAKLTKGVFGGIFNRIKGVISLPFRAIGGIGDSLRKKQIRQGRDEAGNAKSRIQFAKTRKMGQYDYRGFDEKLAENSDNQEFLEEVTARTGMLAHGAEYFEKEVQKSGVMLSKVLSKYYKLGWFAKDKAGYKRIKQYIKDNDVESAIQELSNIQKSRPTGGKLNDKEADEAINQFTAANEKYQIAKMARDKFGNINKEENEKWMETEFGKDWRKMDAEKLFKYSSRELSSLTGKDVNKANLFSADSGAKLVNTTLEKMTSILEDIRKGIWMSPEDKKEYDAKVQSGTEKATELRHNKKDIIKSTLLNKGIELNNDDTIIDKLYANEDVFNLVLFAASKGIVYDVETIKNLCDMDLDKDDIRALKSMPLLGKLPEDVLEKFLSDTRNNHATIFGNRFFGRKKIKNKNLKQLEDALSSGVSINGMDDAVMVTSGGLRDTSRYDHSTRNKYYKELDKLGLIGKVIDIDGESKELTKEMILSRDGLSYDQLDKIITSAGGKSPVKEKTSIRSAIYNNTGFLRKGAGLLGKGTAIAGAGLLASPIVLPLAALGLTGAGIAGIGAGVNSVGKTIGDIKNLGIKGFINDRIIRHKTDNLYNSDTLGGSDDGEYRYESTDYGTKRYVKVKGEWQLDKSDSETQETLDREKENQEQKKSFFSSITSMKDGILGIFNHNKEKDEEEKKEPWYKKLFDFDLSSISGKAKFGAIALGGLTAIGAIKNMWDNEGQDGIMHKFANKISEFVGPYLNNIKEWFTGESEGGGLPAFMENHVYPNLFKGFNVVFQQVLPALIKSFVISLPKIIKAGIDGIGSLISNALGWGGEDENKNDNKTSLDEISTVDGTNLNSSLSGGSSGSGSWLKEVLSDAKTVSSDMTAMANVVNTGKESIPQRNIAIEPGETINNSTDDSANYQQPITNSNTNTANTDTNTNNNANIANNIITAITKNSSNNNATTNTNSSTQNVDTTQQLTFNGHPGYKLDEKGNLIPLTVQDYIDNNGIIPEYYTEVGARYIYDENTGMYISEKGDTYTQMDDGLLPRLGNVATRSLLTGRNIGIARLAKSIGGTSLGKFGKGFFGFADKALKKIPFIGTSYKLGTAGFKGLGKLTNAASNLGVTGHTYLSYAADALKEGYSVKEVAKDITGDISGNIINKAKNSGIGKTVTNIKNSKGAQLVSSGINSVKDKMLNSNTGKKITDLTSKTTGALDDIIKWVKSGLEYIFNNNTIFKKIQEALKRAGKESTEKATKNVINEMIEKLMKNFSGKAIKKLSSKVITKLVSAISSAGVITAIFSIVDFTVGYDQAEAILGIEEVSFVQRLIAGLVNIITNELFFGLVDAETIVDWCVDIIFPIFNIDTKEFENQRKAAEEAAHEYNELHGENLSTEEYLKKDKWTWKVTQGWESVKKVGGDIINAGTSAVGGLIDTGKNLWNSGTKAVGDFVSWINPFDNKKEEKKPAENKNLKSFSESGVFSNASNKLTEVIKSVQSSETNIDGSNLTTDTALSGNLNIAQQQLNQFDVLSQNMDSAYTIMDKMLGKIYGFKNSSGDYITLSEGIEDYDDKTSLKGQYTFSDLVGTITGTMGNLISSVTNSISGNTTTSSSKSTFGSKIGGFFNSLFGGTGTQRSGEFVSQVDPRYKNQKFNTPGDTQMQTLGDSGCAPATAANVLNLYAGRGTAMENASKAALKFKSKNGGVTPDYFESYLSNNGIGTYSTMDKNEILSGIGSGKPTILLGTDPTNKANTPYGASGSHYVLATGLDGKGNVIVQDPESRRPNALYPVKALLNQTHLGMITGRGTMSSINSKLLRSKINLAGTGTYGSDTVEYKVWNSLRAAGYNEIATAAAMGNIKHESGFNASAIEKGSGAGFGLIQWTGGRRTAFESYAAKKGKSPSDLGVQIEYLLIELANQTGAWTTASTKYGFGKLTRDDWANGSDINTSTKAFMACFERPSYNSSTNHIDRRLKSAAEYYEAFTGTPIDSSLSFGTSSDSSTSGASNLFSMLAKLPEAYFGPELMSLFGLSSSTSTESDSTGGTSPEGIDYSNASQTRKKIIDIANSYVGKIKYSQGKRNEINTGGSYADCSSFVQHVYKKAMGVDVGSNGRIIRQHGTFINESEALPGDLAYTYSRGHVGFYAGNNEQGQKMYLACNGGVPDVNSGPGVQLQKLSNFGQAEFFRPEALQGMGSGKDKEPSFEKMSMSEIIKKYKNKGYNFPKPNSDGTYSINMPIDTYYTGRGTLPSLSTDNSMVSLNTINSGYGNISSSQTSSVEKLLGVIIDVLRIIANNSEKLSEIVSLLSKSLDIELTDNDISKLSSNNAQIKNKIANALKIQGSANGMGSSIMNASTESLATAMYSIARA